MVHADNNIESKAETVIKVRARFTILGREANVMFTVMKYETAASVDQNYMFIISRL